MTIIQQQKKMIINLIFIFLITIVIYLGVFVSIDKTFAFSSGLNINAYGRGVSVTDLINDTSGSFKDNLKIISVLIFALLGILFIADILYGFLIKKNNQTKSKTVENFIVALWFLFLVIYSILFVVVTTPKDYNSIRVYGPALFGILGLILILGFLISNLFIFKKTSFGKTDSSISNSTTTHTPILPIKLTEKLRKIYLGIFIVMLAQNVLVFGIILSMSFLPIPLTVDLLGIFILALVSIYLAILSKKINLLIGGLFLIIWIIISVAWRSLLNIYSGNPQFCLAFLGTTCPNNDRIFGLIILGSFFLGIGLILTIIPLLGSEKGRTKKTVIIYAVINILGAFTIFLVFIKLMLVPVVAIILYYNLYKYFQSIS